MTTDLKTVKANDALTLLDTAHGVTYDAKVTKAGAAHLLCETTGHDPQQVRIARATGAQVSAKPAWFVMHTVADLTGATHDARHTVTDVQVSDDVQQQFVAAFGAGTTVRVQVISRDGAVIDSVAQVQQAATGYSEDFSGDADTDALLRSIIDARKATGEDPVQPAPVPPPAAPAAPPAYALTDADRALVGRVAKVNADMRAKNPDPSAFDAAYFARTKSLMKAAGDNAAHLNALCDACAAEGNRLLGIAPAAPQQAPQAPAPVAPAPAVTDPPAAPAAPVTAPQQGTDGDAPAKAPKAKRGTKRATITDADVEGAKAAIRTVAATAPTTTDDPPAQAPAATANTDAAPAVAAAQAVSDDGLAGLHPLLTQYDAAVALADRGGMTGDTRDAFSAFRAALLTHLNTAFVQAPQAAPKGNRAARRAQATMAPRAPRSSAPKSSVADLSPTWVRVAGIIGRHAAKFVGGKGPVSADDVRALEHPYITRTPKASRDIVVEEAARIATDLRGAANTDDASAPKAPKAPRTAAPKARKAVVAGGTVRINADAQARYADALNADELTGAFTVVKVSGARVFARTAAGDEVRLPLADVTAC